MSIERDAEYLAVAISFGFLLAPILWSTVHSFRNLPNTSFAIGMRFTFFVANFMLCIYIVSALLDYFGYDHIYTNYLKSINSFVFSVMGSVFANAQVDYLKTILPLSENVLSNLVFRLRLVFVIDGIIGCLASFFRFYPKELLIPAFYVQVVSVSLVGVFDMGVNLILFYITFAKIIKAAAFLKIRLAIAWIGCMAMIGAACFSMLFIEPEVGSYVTSILGIAYALLSYVCLVTVRIILYLYSAPRKSTLKKTPKMTEVPQMRAKNESTEYNVPAAPFSTPNDSINDQQDETNRHDLITPNSASQSPNLSDSQNRVQTVHFKN